MLNIRAAIPGRDIIPTPTAETLAIAVFDVTFDAFNSTETFSAILVEDTNNLKSYTGLIKSHIALGDLDQAEAILNGMPLEMIARGSARRNRQR